MTSTDSSGTSPPASSITNIVVLMLENRSYDNVLGWLYGSGNLPPYNVAPSGQNDLHGLTGNESNRLPHTEEIKFVANQITVTSIPGEPQVYPATTIPVIDPGESFDEMAQQYTGSVPATNPYVDGPPSGTSAMSGFVANYAKQKNSTANLQDVMNYFTPAQLPVSAYLANHFAVCDTWFASVPTQTFTNRAFAHCAAPGVLKDALGGYFSLIDDVQYVVDDVPLPLIELPSVMEYLDTHPPAGDAPYWRIYFHDYSISLMTVPYVKKVATTSDNLNVCTFSTQDYNGHLPKHLGKNPSTFFEDVANGTLPPYSFIEPRYARGHSSASPPPAPNSNHPGRSAYFSVDGVTATDPPIDFASGELLLMQVFNTLRNSEQYWPGTLFIVTYDEPGGLYDHIPPVPLTPPATVNWGKLPTQPFAEIPTAQKLGSAVDGFNFNVSGGRVPTILISPWIEPGSTLTSPTGTPFEHSSLVRTVLDNFCSTSASLNARDAAAPSVLRALTASPDNQTPAFSGTILTAPSSLTFRMTLLSDTATQILQVDAGGPTLAISQESSASWLTLAFSPATGIVAASVNKRGLAWDRLYQTTFTIQGADSSDKIEPVVIAVTMILKIL